MMKANHRDVVRDLVREAADHHATIDLTQKPIHAAVEEARP